MFTVAEKIDLLAFETQSLGVSLRILSTLINELPFLITADDLNKFELSNSRYIELHSRHKLLTGATEDKDKSITSTQVNSYLDAKAAREEINTYLLNLLRCSLPKIKFAAVSNKLQSLGDLIHNFFQNVFIAIYETQHLTAEKNRLIADYFENEKTHERILSELTMELKQLRETGLQQFALTELESPQNAFRASLGHAAFDVAKATQSHICALRKSIDDPNYHNISTNLAIDLESVTLDKKEDYADLIFCLQVLKPDVVTQGLEYQCTIVQFHHAKFSRKLRDLKSNLGGTFSPSWRLIRSLHLYQSWQTTLARQIAALLQMPKGFNTSMEIQRVLTYAKKEVLKANFAAQKASVLIQDLWNVVTHETEHGLNTDQILLKLRKRKEQLCIQIAEIEQQLTAKQTCLQKVLSDLLLGIIEQPMYQLGYLAHNLGTNILDQMPWLPVLGAKLDENYARKWRHAKGAAFLALSFLVANWHQYSYYFLATGNRFLFSHIDCLIQLGSYIDTALQYTVLPNIERLEKILPASLLGIFSWLKDKLRFDEIGVLEKEAILQWLAGLFLNLCGAKVDDIIPHVCGYAAATAGASLTSKLVIAACKEMNIDDKIAQVVTTTVHVAIYPYAYGAGYRTGHFFFSSQPHDTMTPTEARKILDVDSSATEGVIRRRYHQKVAEHHPDTCALRDDCDTAEEKTIELNRAFAALVKKNN